MVDRRTRGGDNLWQRLFGAGEERLGQVAEDLLSSQRVREAITSTFQTAVRTKGQVDRNMEMILAALNLPTRRDFDKLYAKVESLQGSLINLSIKLDRLAAQQAAAAAAATPPPSPKPAKAKARRAPTRRRKTAAGHSGDG